METKTLLRLIKDDISHLQGITDEFTIDSFPSSDEVELALVRAKALIRQLELLQKLTDKNDQNLTAYITADKPKNEVSEYQNSQMEHVEPVENEAEYVAEPTPVKIEVAAVLVSPEVLQMPETTTFEKEINPIIIELKEELPAGQIDEEKKMQIEELGESQQMVNDILSKEKSESGYQLIPIKSIWDGIGINDRVLFIRELFENNSSKFETSVTAINQLNTIHEAVNYLKMNFKWHKTEASEKFLVLVKRRFTK